MIFLSHNNKDKPQIEPIALALRSMYGKEKIFYDSWSMQPGESIIGKMNEGLQSCRFFFLFLTQNSINSKFVSLEWHAALMMKLSNETEFIPVLIEKCDIPPLLRAIQYVDYYHEGPEVTIKQIVDVIENRNIFTPTNGFNNAVSFFKTENDVIRVRIEAQYYMEPHSTVVMIIKNSVEDIEVNVKGYSLPTEKYNDL